MSPEVQRESSAQTRVPPRHYAGPKDPGHADGFANGNHTECKSAQLTGFDSVARRSACHKPASSSRMNGPVIGGMEVQNTAHV